MTNMIERAAALATARHDGQWRKGAVKLPYVSHCQEVAQIVSDHGGTEAAICAAWLHDAVEDTQTTPDELRALFGAEVADLVAEVTDDPKLNKTAQRAAQIASAAHKSPEAAMIKAADQTSNMRSIVTSDPFWPRAKALDYIRKAEAVVNALPISDPMRQTFEDAAKAAREKVSTFA